MAQQMAQRTDRKPMERNLAMELVRVTEAAALSAVRFMGKGDKEIIPQMFRPHPWHGLDIGPSPPEILNVFVEITPYDLTKYEVDKVLIENWAAEGTLPNLKLSKSI